MLSFRSTTFAAVVAAAALTAGPAAAKDFCTSGVPGCSNSYGGVQEALDAAASVDDGPDRVLIASGIWIGNFHANGDVTIEGSGPLTVLSESVYGGANDPSTLYVNGSLAKVRNLRIKLPSGVEPRGLSLTNGASAENVTIDGTGATSAIGAFVMDGSRFSGSIDLPAGNMGAVVGADGAIVGARIAGAPALEVEAALGTAIVSRSTIVGRGDSAVDAASGALTIEDTLVDARAPGSGPAVTTYADYGAALHKVDLRNVTILGHGDDPGSVGIDAKADAATEAVTVSARDSVVANFGSHALSREGNGTANLSLDHVDVFPASDPYQSGAGTLTATGLTSVDPGFAVDGFTPAPGSPLIDAGTPGPLDAGESATDLAGNPRVAAFGCDEARRDLGAIEAVGSCAGPPPAPPVDMPPAPAHDSVAPSVTKLRIVRRRSVRFTLSEAARVTVRVARAHHKPLVLRRAAKSGGVTLRLKRVLRHGRYAIRVIAVDDAGNRSAPAVARRKI